MENFTEVQRLSDCVLHRYDTEMEETREKEKDK